MSQSIGLNYKSRIPTLSDDASIEEALKVYHYGVDNYSSQPIPADSIEGNFQTIDGKITAIQSILSTLGTLYVEAISASAAPNVISPQNATTVPLTIRGFASQTEPLQRWQNSSSTNLSTIFTDGAFGTDSYLSVGNNAQSTTVALDVRIKNASHHGIIVRKTATQTENMQEWQNSSGTAISWVDKNGLIFSSGTETQTINPFLLTGC